MTLRFNFWKKNKNNNNNKKTLKLDIYDKHLSWVGGAGRKKIVRMVMLNDLEIYLIEILKLPI